MTDQGNRAQPPSQETGQKKKIRKARRVEFGCTLTFSVDEIEAGAKVTNLSTTGCRAESATNVAAGLELRVLIHLPNEMEPVAVERAVVRWVSGDAFGLHFVFLYPSQRERLRALLEKIK